MEEKYYTVSEVAEIYRVGVSTLSKYIREGKLKTVRVGASHRISETALYNFLKLSEEEHCLEKRRKPE